MLIFADDIEEAKYLREIREAIRAQFKESRIRTPHIVTEAILASNPRFAKLGITDLILFLVEEERHFENC
jgi:hypothetical protein